MSVRRFRFGVQATGTPYSFQRLATGEGTDPHVLAERWRQTAQDAESLGYSTLFSSDHLGAYFGDQLAPVPALAAAAEATRTLRLGTLVWANDYKHPVVLAKEVATLDALSGGRMELGIGAGWMRSDYEQVGIPYDPPGVRIDRMMEGIAVMRGFFADGPFTYEGRHYTIRGLEGLPKPRQKPHPPILLAGGGKRILTLAAQHADIVGVNVDLRAGEIGAEAAASASAAATVQKIGWIRDAAGPRYGSLELQILAYVTFITPHREAVLREVAERTGTSVEMVAEWPYVLVGTVDQIVADLERRRERFDISYIVVHGDQLHAFAPVVARLHGT